MADPGWLTPEMAATYLAVPLATFHKRVKAGKLPKPSYHLGSRLPRWQRAALDAAMGDGAGLPKPDLSPAIKRILEEGRRAAARRQSGQKAPGRRKSQGISLSGSTIG